MDQQEATYRYVGAFVDELARSGVRHAVICPGSRSTPLALCFAAQADFRIWTLIDERSAAFFALGIARATQAPVALVCTSGTAAANFLPAIAEANLGRVALLVLTADRPPELRDVGAPQAMDQLRLYGTHVKWSAEMALPEASTSLLRYSRTMAGRAVATARAVPAGPVHLNLPFREPLIPAPTAAADPEPQGVAWQGRPGVQPYVAAPSPRLMLDDSVLTPVANSLAAVERGLIVVGPQHDPGLAEPLTWLADRTGFPILADPLSQLRHGAWNHALIVDNYDAFLRDATFVEAHPPELVLRFGAMPTSKPLLLFLQAHPACQQFVIDGAGGWNDPTLMAEQILHASEHLVIDELLARLPGQPRPTEWTRSWQATASLTRATLREAIASLPEAFEGRIFTELAGLLPAGATLMVGNSMPIRDCDTFFEGSQRSLRVVGNRGVNGIDGVVSTALGLAAAGEQVVLALGDLSFYHDLNGLLAAKLHRLRLTVVVINNDGGGIFSFLPQATYPEHFEQLFGTPHGLDFSPAVAMYGGRFERVHDWDDFRQAVAAGLAGDGLTVIEVPTDRASNVLMHRQLWHALEAAGRATGAGAGLMPRLLINGVYLNVEQHAGPPGAPALLLLHGFTGSSATWQPHMETLADVCTTVAIDALGHGRSDAPADPERYGMSHVVADTLAVIDRMRIERFALLGYSMGGRMALHFALAAGERLDALLLESASPGLQTEAERSARVAADSVLAALAEREGIAAFVARWEDAPIWASQASLPAHTRASLREQRLSGNPLGLANSLRGAGTGAQQPLGDRLAAITTPTLLIAGERDPKFCHIARAMCAAMPRAELRIVADAGHAVHLEASEQFDQLVSAFIRRHAWHP